MEILRSTDGSEIGIVAATWELNPKVTFDSLADEFKRNPSKAWRNYGSVISTSIDAASRSQTQCSGASTSRARARGTSA